MKTIELTRGKVAFVDDADYVAVSQFKWYAKEKEGLWYAARNLRKTDGKRTTQYLHQFLLPGVPEIDHRDGNGLNDRWENLRSVTHKQNMQGFRRKKAGLTSKFRGVSWHKRDLIWHAQIRADGKQIHIGYFENEIDAARAYDAAALKYFGKGAYLNFP